MVQKSKITVKASNIVFDTSFTQDRYCSQLIKMGYSYEEALSEWEIEFGKLPSTVEVEVENGSEECIREQLEDTFGYPIKSLTIEQS